MKINKLKSGILPILCTRRPNHKLNYLNEYKGYPIVSKYKYLGVTFNKSINFNDHL